MAYTPGPWKYEKDKNRIISTTQWFIEPSDPVSIVNLYGAMGGDDTNADAQLMASAPDLLQALQNAIQNLQGWASDNGTTPWDQDRGPYYNPIPATELVLKIAHTAINKAIKE